MNGHPHIFTVIGARPQFIKAFPVSRALRAHGIRETVLHTGQHFDAMMSDVFFDELGLRKPDHRLEARGGGHGAMTGQMLIDIEPLLAASSADAVLVYGDTNSTLAGALTAAKLHLPVIHVEAGLRSFNRAMPEEINRVLTDHLSTLLLCSTSDSLTNLAREGIASGVHHVGDVMYDSTLAATKLARDHATIMGRLGLSDGGYAVATLHRQETTDDPATLKQAIDFIADHHDGPIILPLHPRTRQAAARFGVGFSDTPIRTIEPVGYVDMCRLMAGAALVFTDSGGLQKEAYFHKVPCITLRTETEWVETITNGWNRLWRESDWQLPRREITEYGNGDAADKVARAVLDWWDQAGLAKSA